MASHSTDDWDGEIGINGGGGGNRLLHAIATNDHAHGQHHTQLQQRGTSCSDQTTPFNHHTTHSVAAAASSSPSTSLLTTTSSTTKFPSASIGDPDGHPHHSPSQRARSLFVHLLVFVAGMVVTYLCGGICDSGAILTGRVEGRMKSMDLVKQSAMATTAVATVTSEPGATSLPFCTATNYVDGSWEYDASITAPPYKSNEWDNKCDEPGYTNSGEKIPDNFTAPTIRAELQYVWQPKECRLVPYSREKFCQLLAGRNILFVGDSIADQHVHSFVHLLHQTPNDIWIRDEFYRQDMINVCQEYYPVKSEATSQPSSKTTPSSSTIKPTPTTPIFGYSSIVHPRTGKPLPGLRVGFKRNNFLNLHFDSNSTQAYHLGWNKNQSWVSVIDKWKYEVIVMNTGIWMIDPVIYRQILVDVSNYMKQHHPQIPFLWRSTQPGHARCHTHWARPQRRLYDIRDTTGGQARFRWEEADERNRIAKEIFPNEYMDVVTMTKLRPDGHMPGECLHYCQPGPVDEWQKVLYHRLALLEPTFLDQFKESSLTSNERKSDFVERDATDEFQFRDVNGRRIS